MSISKSAWLQDGSDDVFRGFIYKLLSLSSLLLQSREWFAGYIGVSGPQYSMMMIVAETDGATVGQIATTLDVSGSFVTTELGKLQRRQIVVKRPNVSDARSTLIALTDLGHRLLLDLGPLRLEVNDMMYGSLTDAQVKQLTAIVDTLHADAARTLHMLNSPEYRDLVAPSNKGGVDSQSAPHTSVS